MITQISMLALLLASVLVSQAYDIGCLRECRVKMDVFGQHDELFTNTSVYIKPSNPGAMLDITKFKPCTATAGMVCVTADSQCVVGSLAAQKLTIDGRGFKAGVVYHFDNVHELTNPTLMTDSQGGDMLCELAIGCP
ncbi:uncharacterized protein L969DRAFT_50476 [Mixia osmundae IAM 14324]|uniref:Uncharacterized protein n=1 Tax=Mixia osmundae (strain CBS 9802 / IAM 14324 / JCM 22182 / KY 12970) TaxID=764103 RepID=G7E6Z9_MIXOS|nr:uncharacterized protein L969DRAFT_50476 [Mixia osmundae IAM 14324]KEI39008.1 hypothetical protein L969DRAFT_50476 [Mixia osmundae IAM 14324]GAA98609.1 hypothetical protein E5Q_05296 [Mixia osmundae IAM 14324]